MFRYLIDVIFLSFVLILLSVIPVKSVSSPVSSINTFFKIFKKLLLGRLCGSVG